LRTGAEFGRSVGGRRGGREKTNAECAENAEFGEDAEKKGMSGKFRRGRLGQF
jgi:hypothetical protein